MDENLNYLPIPEPTRLFLESCLWDKGIKDIPEDLKEEMIQNLAARLNPWLLQSALMQLAEKDAEEFDKLTDETEDPQKIQEFLSEKIPNIDSVFGDAMASFKQQYIEG